LITIIGFRNQNTGEEYKNGPAKEILNIIAEKMNLTPKS